MISACKFVVEGDIGTLYGDYDTLHDLRARKPQISIMGRNGNKVN